jgi:hypothetical protein
VKVIFVDLILEYETLSRIPLTYEVFHFLIGEALVSAVKIYFTPQNPSKEKFKLLAGTVNRRRKYSYNDDIYCPLP